MGTYRSTYPIISDTNRDSSASIPQFAWFHPGNYTTSIRKGINPFQGSQHNPEGNIPFTTRLIPINNSANPIDPFQGSQHNPEVNRLIPINELTSPIEADLKSNIELESVKLAKKAKSSRKASNDCAQKPRQKKSKEGSSNSPKVRRRNQNLVKNDSSLDSDGTLSPFCSCTGVPRQCYRWGSGGWQSACCTTNISEYPLPMRETRPGARTAGRKMSHGAFVKLVQRLSSEGFDLNTPIDLKDHWARHGTNKFVIIK